MASLREHSKTTLAGFRSAQRGTFGIGTYCLMYLAQSWILEY